MNVGAASPKLTSFRAVSAMVGLVKVTKAALIKQMSSKSVCAVCAPVPTSLLGPQSVPGCCQTWQRQFSLHLRLFQRVGSK